MLCVLCCALALLCLQAQTGRAAAPIAGGVRSSSHTRVGRALASVSCASTILCVATDTAGFAVAGATSSAPATLTVSLAGSGSGGVAGLDILCPGVCSHDYPAGTVLALAPITNPGSIFTGWSGACSGGGYCTVTMNGDQAVTATFSVGHTLAVSLAGEGSGTVAGAGISCPGTCSTLDAAGTTVSLSAAPAGESVFTGWSGACSGTGACQVTLSSDQAVIATFGPKLVAPSSVALLGPRCELLPETRKVTVTPAKLPKGAGRKHPATPLGTLSLAATCNQGTVASLRGTVVELVGRKPRHGKQRSDSFRLIGITVRLRAGARTVLTTRLPKAARIALRAGAHESATFTLTATDFNGTATVSARIRQLRPADRPQSAPAAVNPAQPVTGSRG